MLKKIKVKPNAKVQSIREEANDQTTVSLKSPPAKGKANTELIKLLAQQFDLPKTKIRIKSGLSSRQKIVEISNDA